MEKLYTINEKYAEIILSKKVYALVSVKKALSNFMNDTYIKIENLNENEIKIYIELKPEKANLDQIIGEFYNELLRESLRYDISVRTKNLRELIVGRALYTTCIDLNDEETREKDNEENYNLDEIAVNWFDKYGNKEE